MGTTVGSLWKYVTVSTETHIVHITSEFDSYFLSIIYSA